MLISHKSSRLIVVVVLALLLGTVAEEASTKMVSTFASSVVSGWLDAVAPLEIPGLATIPAAVGAGVPHGNGSSFEFQASGARAAAKSFNEPADGFESAGEHDARPLPQAMTSALAELFDIGAGSSASSPGGSSAGGQNPDRRGGGSEVSGGGSAGEGTPSGQSSSGGSSLLREALRQLAEETSSPDTPFGHDMETSGESSADSFLPVVPTRRNRQAEPDGLHGGLPGSDNGGPILNVPGLSDDWVNPGTASLQSLEPALAPVLNALLPVESALGPPSSLAVVPEPPTLVLFGSGLMSLAAWCRRAKTKRAAVPVPTK